MRMMLRRYRRGAVVEHHVIGAVAHRPRDGGTRRRFDGRTLGTPS